MKVGMNHIVSGVNWQTQIDRKEQAFELQQKISTWSKFDFERVVGRVFDQFCPSEYNWRIDQLEIDLGSIQLNELESELTFCLPRLIAEQFQRYLLEQEQHKQEVVETETSQLQLLESYLEKGILPWWHTKNSGFSINRLIEDQLKSNQRQFIQSLFRLGKKENTRKRLAWQVKEALLVKIVIGIEPSHHQEILGFKDQMEQSQKKDRLVSAGQSEFGKIIWFWIFTHLFVERGSFFNKVAYTRSLIKQMSAHYNLKEKVLLKMIHHSLEQINKKQTVRADFIQVIKTLLNDKSITKLIEPPSENDCWSWLSNGGQLPPKKQLPSGDELLAYLQRTDSDRLYNILKQLENKEVDRLVNRLTILGLQLIYQSLISRQGGKVADSYLSSLYGFLYPRSKAEENANWLKQLINFLRFEGASRFDRNTFLQNFFKEKENQGLLKSALKSATRSELATVEYGAEIYRDLYHLHAKKTFQAGHFDFERTFIQLLEAFSSTRKRDKKQLNKTITSLRRLIRIDAALAFNLLQNYKDVKALIHLLLDDSTVLLFISKNSILFDFAQKLQMASVLGIQTSGRLEDLQYESLKDELVRKVLEHLLLHKGESLGQAIKEVMRSIYSQSTTEEYSYLVDLIRTITAEELPKGIQELELSDLMQSLESTETNLKSIDRRDTQNKLGNDKKEIHNQLELLLQDTSAKPEQIGKLFRELILASTKEEQIGLHELLFSNTLIKLLPSFSVQQFNQWKKEQLTEVLKKYPGISNHQLERQLLILIADYPYHRGNVEQLQVSWDRWVQIHYPKAVKQKTTVLNRVDQQQLTQLTKESLNHASATAIRDYIKEHREPKKVMQELEQVSLTELMIKLTEITTLHDFFEDALCFYRLVMPTAPNHHQQTVEKFFLPCLIKVIKGQKTTRNGLQELLEKVLQWMQLELDLSVETICNEFKSEKVLLTHRLYFALKEKHRLFALLSDEKENDASSSYIQLLNAELIEELCVDLITYGNIPAYLSTRLDSQGLIKDLILRSPLILTKAIIKRQFDVRHLRRLFSIQQLLQLVALTGAKRLTELNRLKQLYQVFGRSNSPLLKPDILQAFLLEKIALNWKNRNWRSLSEDQLWRELTYYLTVNYHFSVKEIQSALNTLEPFIPLAYRKAFKQWKEKHETKTTRTFDVGKKEKLAKTESKPLIWKKERETLGEPIPVSNAGLVLINDYIKMLFQRLQLLTEDQFRSEPEQQKAVKLLQYIATGTMESEESHLPLNKLLCGLFPTDFVTTELRLKKEEEETISGLIKAVINYWPEGGITSIDGFRGTWLIREGILSEYENNWELVVEKKSYDILLNKIPFSFSVIKYPWMEKPLKVNWTY